ncbi:hypothetical protein AB6Q13_11390 [Ralstonia solanacearum]|uniref:hypothetical protein n=1 Tax=Ralstonia solanacearum TaxID=305 RepID=UPI001FF7FDFA|nr:hypothetical protein [Ralstonia solanacearum]MDB0507717.1 hypothetical protein [Ralstonia solanacearum]MDB0511987.1 hypothetical protein [Ralstonia solanacearum]MDB0566525.1 hypothetical protein [Ralstonia solanacearum]MDB0575792.1 hypothetical protein [Ralstonia solanacearum]
MKKSVYALLSIAMVFWAICGAYPTSSIPLGWIGTLLGSIAGLLATISSYLTEDRADTRGAVIFKSESPIKFFIAYALLAQCLLAWRS